MLWQFCALLVVHWFGDFVCQTHWQASNKSKSIDALVRHVATYTLVLAVGTVLVFGVLGARSIDIMGFILLNCFFHFITDCYTSRWSSTHFGKALAATITKGRSPERAFQVEWADPGMYWHNFFVIIGFDQVIHQLTLAITMWWFFA